MNATLVHADVQRSRFFNLTVAALAGFFKSLTASSSVPIADATREAAEIRRVAASYASSHPSFAADLYAAADRHEQVAGV